MHRHAPSQAATERFRLTAADRLRERNVGGAPDRPFVGSRSVRRLFVAFLPDAAAELRDGRAAAFGGLEAELSTQSSRPCRLSCYG